MKNIFFLVFDITNSAGTERAVINISNILSSMQEFEVSIISITSKIGIPYYKLNEKVRLFHLNIDNTVRNPILKVLAYKKVFEKLRAIVPHGSYILGTDIPYNIIITFLKGVKKIGCAHMGYKSAHMIRNILRYVFYRNLDAVVVLTERDKKYYKFLRNVYVIPNSLSFPPQKKVRYDTKQILSIGRLTYQKGFDMLIDIASIVCRKHPDWRFLICGAGEAEEELKNKIDEKKLNQYVIIAPPTKDVISLYLNSDIYVMSSRFEGLPMVLIEAQSCGLPIISFDCPEGPSAIIHNNKDGFLVPPNNIQKFAEKIYELIENEELRIRFGNNAFINAEAFSTDSIKRLWIDFLNTL